MIDLPQPRGLCTNNKPSKETLDAIRENWKNTGSLITEMILTPEEVRLSDGLSMPPEDKRIVWEQGTKIIITGPES